MHVAVHGGEHHLALGVSLALLQVLLEVRDGTLHHLCALQHKGQDELAGTEPVADILHGGQEDGVQHGDRVELTQRQVDLFLDAVLAPVEDLRVDALDGGHPLVGIGAFRGGPRRRSTRRRRSGR